MTYGRSPQFETVETLLKEIKHYDEVDNNYKVYLDTHPDLLEDNPRLKDYQWDSSRMADDLVMRAADSVSRDPNRWYVLDSKGQELHLGDHYVNQLGEPNAVMGLGKDIVFNGVTIEAAENLTKMDSIESIENDLERDLIIPHGYDQAQELIKSYRKRYLDVFSHGNF